MLGDAVRRAPEHGQQPGRRRGDDETAVAALDPTGHEDAGRADVGHDVDLERGGPLLLGRVETAAALDAGVGAEQVDLAEDLVGPGQQPGDADL